jgi:glycosyltransferase involved in cell wall biosynthesis
MKTMNLLVISYHFPPSGAVGAKRVAGFCKYLPDYGVRPTVLTVDEASCEVIDRSVRNPGVETVARVQPRATLLERYQQRRQPNFPIGERGSPRGEAVTTVVRHRSREIRRNILALLTIPDKQRGWLQPALKTAISLVHDRQIDAVFTSAPPWTTHAVGYAVSRHLSLPWIADFRDQWTSDPWRKFLFDGFGPPSWRTRVDLRAENRWLQQAALCVCITARQKNSLLRSHPSADADRVVIIPNGFDSGEPRHCTTRSPGQSGPKVLLHIGELYGDRHIGIFCRAISTLTKNGALSADEISVKLIGRWTTEIEDEAHAAAGELIRNGRITFIPQVDWTTAQEELIGAAVLLIFQGDHPTAIPAKFYEYIQTGKPVLAIAGEGELKDVILRTKTGFVAGPNDEEGMRRAIGMALLAPTRSDQEIQRVATEFDMRNLTAKLAAEIHRVVGTSSAFKSN